MAVMTTQHSDGLALEQMTEPVPSSDKMALDLDINGTSTHDESKTEDQLPSEIELNKPSEIHATVSTEVTSAPEVNGDMNAKAHSLNSSVAASTIVESQAQIEKSSETRILSQLSDSETTPESAVPIDTPKPAIIEGNHTTPDLPTSADAMMESAVENTSIETTVLPIVEAPVSDLREDISPLTKELSQEAGEHSIPTKESKERSGSDATGEKIADLVLEDVKEAPVSDTTPQNTNEEPASDAKPKDITEEHPSSSANEEIKNESVVEDMNLTFDAPRPDLPPSSPNNAAPSVDMDTSPQAHSQPEQLKTESITDAPEPSAPSKDIDMVDAPEQPQVAKIAREREDDDSDMQPSAKRTKTEESEEREEVNGSSVDTTTVSQNGADDTTMSPELAAVEMTPHVSKEIIKIIKNVLKTQAGRNFKAPVAVLWPTFQDSYKEKISNEIDLGTMEKKLKNGSYKVIGDLKDDLDLLYNNAATFNGADNVVTAAANDVRKYIVTRLPNLPAEPPGVAKPVKKAKRPAPIADAAARAPAARRPSRGASGTVAPAVSTSSATTFALDPVTSTPLIRRDSTKDGRPKREIHPPKNKDLPYSSVRPKSKKFSIELKWCEEVLNELKKPKHLAYSSPFLQPVDPVALQIPNYFTVIKTPMDISVVTEKLHNGAYTRAKDFEADVRLIFHNCYKFNPDGNAVRVMGQNYEKVFNEVMGKKDRWIADHQPQAASPEREVESEDEESEEEPSAAPGPSTGPTSQMTERLLEEQNKLIDMLSRGDDADLIKMQKDMVGIVKKRVDDMAAAAAVTAAAKKPKKVAKPSKASKKAPAPPKKATSGTTKKSGGSRRVRYMGTFEKEVISNGIGALPEDVSNTVMGYIKADQPNISTDEEGILELDIDQISVEVLWKIYDLINLHVPAVEANLRETYEAKDEPRVAAKPTQKKKNKPMSKNEQERKIAHLRDKMQEFRGATSRSQEPVESVETQQQEESSGDESSDSEEE